VQESYKTQTGVQGAGGHHQQEGKGSDSRGEGLKVRTMTSIGAALLPCVV
jgi:hypothetical protein